MKIDSFTRRALWELHGKICFYCNKHLGYREIEIDHLIPLSNFKKNNSGEIFKELGLKEFDDPDILENLVVSCRSCNGLKSSLKLASGYIAIVRGKLIAQKPQLIRLIENYKSEDKRTKYLMSLQGALELGEITEQDLGKAITSVKNYKGSYYLSTASMFGNIDIRELSVNDIDEIMNSEKILPSWCEEGVMLDHDNYSKRLVKTLRDYETAISEGYFALSNTCMKTVAVFFERPLKILSYLEKARYADISYIKEPFVGLADLHLIPSEILFDFYFDKNTPEHLLNCGLNPHIESLVSRDFVKIESVTSYSLGVGTEENYTYLFEIMRADFDDDGIEEILVGYGGSVKKGTLVIGDVFCLKRSSFEEIFSIS